MVQNESERPIRTKKLIKIRSPHIETNIKINGLTSKHKIKNDYTSNV